MKDETNSQCPVTSIEPPQPLNDPQAPSKPLPRRHRRKSFPVQVPEHVQAIMLRFPLLQDAIKTSQVRLQVRIAMNLMEHHGFSQKRAARAVGMAMSNLCVRLQQIKQHGPAALESRRRFSGPVRKHAAPPRLEVILR